MHSENGACFCPARVAHFEVLEKQVEKNGTGAYKCQRRKAAKEAAESTEELPGWTECIMGAGRRWKAILGEAGSGL